MSVLQCLSHHKICVRRIVVVDDAICEFIEREPEMPAQNLQQPLDAGQHAPPQSKGIEVVLHICEQFAHGFIVGEAFPESHDGVCDEADGAVGYLPVRTLMLSTADVRTYRLVDDMHYDMYGNVTYKKYGNGTELRYTYHPLRKTQNVTGSTLAQSADFTYLYNNQKPNAVKQIADSSYSYDRYGNTPLGNYAVPDGWPGKVVKHGKGEVPGPPVWFEEEDAEEAVAGVGYQSDNQREKDVFFYHTDHLQSTTYLTDSAGNVCQFLWYAPYGEALIDEHIGSYENPYKFSGKELDEHTGLYDHGARHRDPTSGVWYGVDPLFENFPEVSPYHYCHANPVRLMDLNGLADTVFFTAKANLSIGAQFGVEVKDWLGVNIDLGSVDIWGVEHKESSEDLAGSTKYGYILKDGSTIIHQGVSISAGLPVVGGADASFEQTFRLHNGYTEQTEDEKFKPRMDIDVAKVAVSFNFIIGVDLEINYDFTSKNTFDCIIDWWNETISELRNIEFIKK